MTEERESSGKVIETFWMPQPEAAGAGYLSHQWLTPEERAVLRRLRRGTRHPVTRGASGIRQRNALRRAPGPDQLTTQDLRSLLQIVMQLGL